MILTNGKDCYVVTADAQIDALKSCGFFEGEPSESKHKDKKDKKDKESDDDDNDVV